MAGLRLLLGLCLWALCPGPAPACSPRCRHGGLCLADGSCLCSKGYEGERCQHGKARRAGPSTLHVIQNAKMGESACDLENADVLLAMGGDTVIKQFVLKVVGIMELVWLLGFVAVQLDGSVEHVT
ncbi:hypothetical protein EK904_005657 [Melospiza melodia maxima]|nr:hypothetical protein EK904_005657 [Melospiza melodia maxima]